MEDDARLTAFNETRQARVARLAELRAERNKLLPVLATRTAQTLSHNELAVM